MPTAARPTTSAQPTAIRTFQGLLCSPTGMVGAAFAADEEPALIAGTDPEATAGAGVTAAWEPLSCAAGTIAELAVRTRVVSVSRFSLCRSDLSSEAC